MKNTVYIDFDDERDNKVIIGKPPEIAQPTNEEEAGVMIANDISTITIALNTLLDVSSDSGFGTKEELIEEVITKLKG